jgi:hypothetical protein
MQHRRLVWNVFACPLLELIVGGGLAGMAIFTENVIPFYDRSATYWQMKHKWGAFMEAWPTFKCDSLLSGTYPNTLWHVVITYAEATNSILVRKSVGIHSRKLEHDVQKAKLHAHRQIFKVSMCCN